MQYNMQINMLKNLIGSQLSLLRKAITENK